MTQEREHTRFSPSKSEQFFLCPGSVNLLARTPSRPSSPYAEEGTLAHTILEAGLRTNAKNATAAIIAADYDFLMDALFPNVHDLNEFKSSINDALEYVYNLIEEIEMLFGDAQLFIEVRVNPPITSAPGEAAGYCDIAIYSATARQLWVIDYKHGKGIAKAVLGNTQIKQYAAGFLYDPESPVDHTLVDKITMVIIQPRAFHPDGDIREYTTTPGDLVDYLMDLDLKIEECLQPDAPLVPGLDQCRFCDAASTCPAREKAAVALLAPHASSIRDINGPMLPDPSQLDVSRLSYIFQHKDMLYKWLDDVSHRIYELQMSGVHVPGTKLVEAEARRQWFGDEDDRAEKLASLTGIPKHEFYRQSFKTITDVEEMIVAAFKTNKAGYTSKKKAAEEAKKNFAYFTIKQSSGKLTLVTEDDKRPPANRALSAFSNVSLILPPTT